MSFASCSLIANRALQTWQMKLVWLVSRRMTWSSQKPISRRRFWISGAAQICRTRTSTPAFTRFNGQTSQRVSALRAVSDVEVEFISSEATFALLKRAHHTHFVIPTTFLARENKKTRSKSAPRLLQNETSD
jgi:hypothetical protein